MGWDDDRNNQKKKKKNDNLSYTVLWICMLDVTLPQVVGVVVVVVVVVVEEGKGKEEEEEEEEEVTNSHRDPGKESRGKEKIVVYLFSKIGI